MVYFPTPAQIEDMRRIYTVVGNRDFLYHEIATVVPFPMQRMQRFEDRGWFKSRKSPKDPAPRIWRFTQGAIDLIQKHDRSACARIPAQ